MKKEPLYHFPVNKSAAIGMTAKQNDAPIKIKDLYVQVQNLIKKRKELDKLLGLNTETRRQNVRTRYNRRGERYLNEHPQKELLSEWLRICIECRRLDSIIKEMSAIEKTEKKNRYELQKIENKLTYEAKTKADPLKGLRMLAIEFGGKS
jgi:hypothetical protein